MGGVGRGGLGGLASASSWERQTVPFQIPIANGGYPFQAEKGGRHVPAFGPRPQRIQHPSASPNKHRVPSKRDFQQRAPTKAGATSLLTKTTIRVQCSILCRLRVFLLLNFPLGLGCPAFTTVHSLRSFGSRLVSACLCFLYFWGYFGYRSHRDLDCFAISGLSTLYRKDSTQRKTPIQACSVPMKDRPEV